MDFNVWVIKPFDIYPFLVHQFKKKVFFDLELVSLPKRATCEFENNFRKVAWLLHVIKNIYDWILNLLSVLAGIIINQWVSATQKQFSCIKYINKTPEKVIVFCRQISLSWEHKIIFSFRFDCEGVKLIYFLISWSFINN